MATDLPLKVAGAALLLAALAGSCAGDGVPTPIGTGITSPTDPPTTSAPGAMPSASAAQPGDVAPSAATPILADGPIAPGTYLMAAPELGWAGCDLPTCPPEPPNARSLRVALTVPAGWEALLESTVLVPVAPRSFEAPDGMGLVVGWNPTGLHTEPCLATRHAPADIIVGTTVEGFVGALTAHPSLQLSDAVDTRIGGYDGRFLRLTAPSDISGCADWRPWEGGIAAQGPDNIWNLWVIDVGGLRMIVLASEFPGTSAEDSAELQDMVESIRIRAVRPVGSAAGRPCCCRRRSRLAPRAARLLEAIGRRSRDVRTCRALCMPDRQEHRRPRGAVRGRRRI